MSISVRLLTAIIVFFLSYSHCYTRQPEHFEGDRPKLVFGIVVEKMRYDYLERMWDSFGDEGFKKLVREGAFCRNASFDYLNNQTSPGYTTIFTGVNPSEHGVISNVWYDRLSGSAVESHSDKKVTAVGGSFENGQRSPANLKIETVGDRMRKFQNFKSRVYSVSMSSRGAVFSGGFSANAAWWFDVNSGQWMSSSYYIDSLPGWVKDFNSKNFPEKYSQRAWEPLMGPEKYFSQYGSDDKSGLFKHNLRQLSRKSDDFELLRESPFGNVLTRDFAISLILNENLGNEGYTDKFILGLSATGDIGQKYGVFSPELQDAYLRLDQEIAHILRFLDENFGKENVLVFLTSDQGAAYPEEYIKTSKIPSGTFSQAAATALLRSYLNASYGEGDWVEAYHSRQVYLNRLQIEESNIQLGEIQMKSARFISNMTGVGRTFTAEVLTSNNFTGGLDYRVQTGFNPGRSGDVILYLRPGWQERSVTEEATNQPVKDSHVPLVWYGGNVNNTIINRPVNMTDIAPTISFLLNMPYGSDFSGQPLMELAR